MKVDLLRKLEENWSEEHEIAKLIRKECIYIQDASFNNWYSNSKKIDKSLEIDASDKSVYWFYDDPENFVTKITKTKKFNKLLNRDIEIEFHIKLSNGLKAMLNILVMGKKGVLKKFLAKPNKVTRIQLPTRGKQVKFLIRFEGKGVVESLTIGVRDYGTKELMKEYYDKKKLLSQKDKLSETNIYQPSMHMYKYFEPRTIDELRIACIFDEFTYESYKNFNLITFRPDNFKEVFLYEKPHILFVESAWKGNSGSWQYKIGQYKNNDYSALKTLISFCNNNNIKTIFWNKEDPIHFDKFIEAAALFDYVFTTDENIVRKYKNRLGHNNVYPLPFAVNPNSHNPIELYDKRINTACFTGSYYANRHEERRVDMDRIFDYLKDNYSLTIFDRNYDNPHPHFQYPERFKKHVLGSLPYSEIYKTYKKYKYLVNVNTVKKSPTMFSRRVYEGLACGTPIISNYSKGMKKMFGDSIIFIEEEYNDLQNTVNDRNLYEYKKITGIRKVLKEHTYRHRLEYILDKIGIEIHKQNEEITVLGRVNNENEFSHLLSNFDQQKYRYRKLIVFSDVEYEIREDVLYHKLNEYNDFKLNSIVSQYFVIFSPNHSYRDYYLEDLYLSFSYSKADIATKKTYIENKRIHNKNKEFKYVSEFEFDISMFKMNSKIYDLKIIDLDNPKTKSDIFTRGVRIFSVDRNNFVRNNNKR